MEREDTQVYANNIPKQLSLRTLCITKLQSLSELVFENFACLEAFKKPRTTLQAHQFERIQSFLSVHYYVEKKYIKACSCQTSELSN